MKKLIAFLFVSAQAIASNFTNPAAPGGSTNDVQISSAGAFVGSSNFTMNGSTVGINSTLDMQGHSIRNVGNGTLTQPAISNGTNSNEGITFENHAGSLSLITNGQEGCFQNGSGQWILTNGTAKIPSTGFPEDGGAGIYNGGDADTLHIAAGTKTAATFYQSFANDRQASTPFTVQADTFTNTLVFYQFSNPAVSSFTATEITQVDQDFALVLINGHDAGFSNGFSDLVLSSFNSPNGTVIASKTTFGSPAARTYGSAGTGVMTCQVASGGPYLVGTWALEMRGR